MQTEPTVDEINAIGAALRTHPNQNILGAQLGALIKSCTPTLDVRSAVGIPTGAGALTKFVDVYLLDHLRRIERHGGDWSYLILAGKAGAESDNNTNAYWGTFASPSASKQLYLDTAKGSISVLPYDASELGPHVFPLASVTQAELAATMTAFLASIDDEASRVQISERLSTKHDYPSWLVELKASSYSDYVRWSKFRREAIKQIFAQRLNAFDVDEATKRNLSGLLEKSQESLWQRRTHEMSAQASKPAFVASAPANASHSNAAVFRDAFIRCIAQLSDAQLRDVNIPFGVAFDAIQGIKKG